MYKKRRVLTDPEYSARYTSKAPATERRAPNRPGTDAVFPLIDMHSMPAKTIHDYLLHYGLVSLAPTAPLTYEQAVMPVPPYSSQYTHPVSIHQSQKRKADRMMDTAVPGAEAATPAVEGPHAEVHYIALRGPAQDGQEPEQADARLCELVQDHWDKQSVKEGETIVNFMYAIRMKDKVIKMQPAPIHNLQAIPTQSQTQGILPIP